MRAGPPFLLFLLAWSAGVRAAARPCNEEDLVVIEQVLAEVTGGTAGTWATDEAGPDHEVLAAAAAEAGCEWFADAGGAAGALDELRWRDSWSATDADDGTTAPWWRIFLPRVELRWVGAFATWGRDEGTREGWLGRLELWLFWSPVPDW